MAAPAQALQIGAVVAPAIAHLYDVIDFYGRTQAARPRVQAQAAQWFLSTDLSRQAPPIRGAVVVHAHALAVLAFPVLSLVLGTEAILGKFGAAGPPTRFERCPRQSTPHAIVTV